MLGTQARELMVKAYQKSHNAAEVAKNFSVSKWTVYHYAKIANEGGNLAVQTSARGRKPALHDTDRKAIQDTIVGRPDITIQEIKDTLHLTVSIETIRQCVIKLGFSRKKKSLHAAEQERPRCHRQKGRMEAKSICS